MKVISTLIFWSCYWYSFCFFISYSFSSITIFISFSCILSSLSNSSYNAYLSSLNLSINFYTIANFSSFNTYILSKTSLNFMLSSFESQRSQTLYFSLASLLKYFMFLEQAPHTANPHYLQKKSLLPIPKIATILNGVSHT